MKLKNYLKFLGLPSVLILLLQNSFSQQIPPLQAPSRGIPPPAVIAAPAPLSTPPVTKTSPIKKIAPPRYTQCILELNQHSEISTNYEKKKIKINLSNIKCIKGVLISDPNVVDFELIPHKNEFFLKVPENMSTSPQKATISLVSNANKISLEFLQTERPAIEVKSSDKVPIDSKVEEKVSDAPKKEIELPAVETPSSAVSTPESLNLISEELPEPKSTEQPSNVKIEPQASAQNTLDAFERRRRRSP